MFNKTLRSLFAHKSWVNTQLFAVLKSLTEEQSGQLGKCLHTLNHIYIVDQIFRAHLSGAPSPFDTTNSAQTPSCEELEAAVAEVDGWYRDYVDHASPDTLSEIVQFMFTSGNPGSMSKEEILLHIITHGVYHRGSVAQALKSISVAPPDDPYTVFLHHVEPDRRAVESNK